MAEARYEDALAAFRRLHDETRAPAELRAQALLRAGISLNKLGRREEARKVLEEVVQDFPNVAAAAQGARRELKGESEADAGFRQKVESLVARLGEQGYERTVQTANGSRQKRSPLVVSLSQAGPRAALFLFSTLGKEDFYTCENAAALLVEFSEQQPAFIPRIVAALRSGDAILRQSIGQALARRPLQR
jgi:tetratricopeptide (TPR) repeat protein